MTIKRLDVVDGELRETARKLYNNAFTPLLDLAANRHVMYDHEFDEVMADPRITKVLTLGDAGQVVGVAAWTTDLTAVPLIAPQFYARRWPQQYAQGRIFYNLFVATDPDARGGGAFVEFFADFYAEVSAVDGLVALDICTFNEQTHRLPQTIRVLLLRMSGGQARAERSDAQSWWTFSMTGNGLALEEAA